jgi:hypothetical protein
MSRSNRRSPRNARGSHLANKRLINFNFVERDADLFGRPHGIVQDRAGPLLLTSRRAVASARPNRAGGANTVATTAILLCQFSLGANCPRPKLPLPLGYRSIGERASLRLSSGRGSASASRCGDQKTPVRRNAVAEIWRVRLARSVAFIEMLRFCRATCPVSTARWKHPRAKIMRISAIGFMPRTKRWHHPPSQRIDPPTG